MRNGRGKLAWLAAAVLATGCGGGTSGPPDVSDAAPEEAAEREDGAAEVETRAENMTGEEVGAPEAPRLVPGPGQEGHDAELEALARLYDRQFHVFNAFGMGLNADVMVLPGNEAERKLMEDFLRKSDGWDFQKQSGKHQFDVVTEWQKVAGLYGGVGIAADACRYAVLRDQGYPQEEVDIARQHLLDALEGLHIATAVTGVTGVIARGFIRLDIPSEGKNFETVPLFDEKGNPLPEPKNNGTWRVDNSKGGQYPDYIWEDSCSRDMYIGWVAGAGAAWEAIRDDPSIAQEVKDRLKTDARDIGRELTVVRKSGYDLELPDADGRTTFHGYLNEQCLDSNFYVPGLRNGFHAAMALGSAAVWAWISEEPELVTFLYDTLMTQRELHLMPAEGMAVVNTGPGTNFSNFNMAFQGIWLAVRYIDPGRGPADALPKLRKALAKQLYDNGGEYQPAEMGQSMFDFVYAAGTAGSSVFNDMTGVPDAGAVARGMETLRQFKQPPFWELEVVNCDQQEIDAKHCTCIDGSEIDLLGDIGWKGSLVAKQPIPMKIRPPSNYYWRSNPYGPNGGGNGSRLMPGVDFRYAYWLGRFVQ